MFGGYAFLYGIRKKERGFMKTVNGIFASAKIFTDDVEDYAEAQIKLLCDNEVAKGSAIRIMPDVHPGKVGVIGLTMTVGETILHGLVGIDIGCGITVTKVKQKKIEFQKLDTVIRENIPAGGSIRKKAHRFWQEFDLTRLRCFGSIHGEKAALSLGTLGGGNHFLEADRDEERCLYIAVHSGSRHLGKEVTEYYLRKGQEELRQKGVLVPYEMTVLEGRLKEDYLYDQQVVKEYAELNRKAITDELVKGMKLKALETFSSSHNYIEDGRNPILRKGAVSAYKGEQVAIPVNMRDGILLGTGMGNPDWNYSAPHGSGRILRRDQVSDHYTVSEFKREMKGIYCSCIGKGTLDEAPFAYRDLEYICRSIHDTVEITKRLTPVYSYKAGD